VTCAFSCNLRATTSPDSPAPTMATVVNAANPSSDL